MENSYKYFENQECKAFPCHAIHGDGYMNCLFCFCPLYGETNCPGNYSFLDDGTKDCSNCTWIHNINNYETIMQILTNKIKRDAQARLPLIKKIRNNIQPKSAGGL